MFAVHCWRCGTYLDEEDLIELARSPRPRESKKAQQRTIPPGRSRRVVCIVLDESGEEVYESDILQDSLDWKRGHPDGAYFTTAPAFRGGS